MASEYITRINTITGEKQIDYTALANLPNNNKFTKVGIDDETYLAAENETDLLKFKAGKNIALNIDSVKKEITINASVDMPEIAEEKKFTSISVGNESITATETNDNVKFAAGDNVTLNLNTAEKTITINATVPEIPEEKKFTDIIVADTSITATTANDSVEFVAGNNVSLNLDPTAKTVTINAELPEIPPATIFVTFTGSGSNYTSDKNYQTLSTSVNNGESIVALYNGLRLPLTEYSASYLKFAVTVGLVHKEFTMTNADAISYTEFTAVDASNNIQSVVHVGTSAPTNTKLLWIDTTATTGGLKYHNGSSWVHVPVAYN